MIDNSYFLDEMKQLLSKEKYELFLASLDKPLAKALRINTKKTDYEFLKEHFDLSKPCIFDKNTYLIDSDSKLGNHPFHNSGLYYLQEPSASCAVNALDVKADDYVLDLCGAPGGKSTQILNRLGPDGFLLCNEYDKKRANTYLSNLERWGYDNYLLTNSPTGSLCPQLRAVFDKVLVDAPCSGASMFKKYPLTVNDYCLKLELACQKRQLDILENAYVALKENGTLLYSTCTYNRYENEDVVEMFLSKHSDMILVEANVPGKEKGFDREGLTARIFPYQQGEGHFVAKMIKTAKTSPAKLKRLNFSKNKLVDQFIEENLKMPLNYTIISDKVFCSKEKLITLNSNIIRSGILLGTLEKNRFEPAHHGYLSYHFDKQLNLTDKTDVTAFLSGNSITKKGYKGYIQICYLNQPLGFVKGDGSTLKNHLPKGLRIAQAMI
ncbi:MAG: RsmF rRNA methyltransferase first C-terminal domain-containing protein [Erysipelotrichaceae bacterium]